MPHFIDRETEAKDLLEVMTRDSTRGNGQLSQIACQACCLSGRPDLGHPSPGQPNLPEAVCVPVSVQGLEVLAIIDPLAATCTHRQLASCRGGKPGSILRGVSWCMANLLCRPQASAQIFVRTHTHTQHPRWAATLPSRRKAVGLRVLLRPWLITKAFSISISLSVS